MEFLYDKLVFGPHPDGDQVLRLMVETLDIAFDKAQSFE